MYTCIDLFSNDCIVAYFDFLLSDQASPPAQNYLAWSPPWPYEGTTQAGWHAAWLDGHSDDVLRAVFPDSDGETIDE